MTLVQAIALDDRVIGAFRGQPAFVKAEFLDREGWALEASRLLEQVPDRPGAAAEAREGDVRQIGAVIGLHAYPEAGLVDFLVKCLERRLHPANEAGAGKAFSA